MPTRYHLDIRQGLTSNRQATVYHSENKYCDRQQQVYLPQMVHHNITGQLSSTERQFGTHVCVSSAEHSELSKKAALKTYITGIIGSNNFCTFDCKKHQFESHLNRIVELDD